MKVHADFTIRDMLHELYKKSDDWRSCDDMRVGEWLEKIAVNIIKNDTCNNVVTSPSLREYGPQVSYDEMKKMLNDSFGLDEVKFDLVYNSAVSTWEIVNFQVPPSFYEVMKGVEEEQVANSNKHEGRILHITVNDIYDGMLVADNIESKPIAQWLTQFADEKIKELLDMEDLRNVTITTEKYLNLLACGKNYNWKNVGHILKLTLFSDKVEFLLAIDGTNIKIKDIQLPASMENAIKLVNKEIENGIKQSQEFTVGEMFTGLMLSKDYTVKQTYTEWLKRAVQNLLNVKKEMPSDYSICLTHGTKINFQDAIDDFVTHNRADDKFEVIYSLSDECGEGGNSAIKFYDIKKVEKDN